MSKHMSKAEGAKLGIVIILSGIALIVALSGCSGTAPADRLPTSKPTDAPITLFDRTLGDVLEDLEAEITETPEPVVEIPLDESNAPDEAPAPAPEPAPAPQPEPAPEPAPQPAPAPEPVQPPPPVLCPAGSVSTASDGYNDTACTYEVCFTITVPDPAHPECDSSFRP